MISNYMETKLGNLADTILHLPNGKCEVIPLGVRKFVVRIPNDTKPTLEQIADMHQKTCDLEVGANFYGFVYS